jgi:predicted glycosyltransferase involved in capsule biosynthesis
MTFSSFLFLIISILSFLAIAVTFYSHIRIRLNNYRARKEWKRGKLEKFSSVEELMKDLKE